MAGGHAAALYVPGTSPVHRLAPQCKLVAALAFIFAVVVTPREAFWAYGLHALVLVVLTVVAGLRPGLVLRRLTVEAPFVAFAVFLPLLAGGERTDVGPLSLSVEGLLGAWNILAKGTLGVATTVVLTATTRLPDVVHGLERLRVPAAFTGITSFMIRYTDVIVGEMHRMKVARQSRGHDPRWFWQAKAVAHSAGALFIRSYERGERVHLAMLSRGFTGTMPTVADVAAPRAQWVVALTLPATAFAVASLAWAVPR